jgi:CheY-like chemotaxis protein
MVAHKANNKSNAFCRADGSPRRVLYAEDQTTSRIITTAMLKRMGFEVDAVEDGERALECARHDNYDVILLDIEMPVMDGVTAARSIRAFSVVGIPCGLDRTDELARRV